MEDLVNILALRLAEFAAFMSTAIEVQYVHLVVIFFIGVGLAMLLKGSK